jgi:enoyl-CoA hydratase/carnithine racemase
MSIIGSRSYEWVDWDWSTPLTSALSCQSGAMAAAEAELLVDRSDRVATITLHRPDALNAITLTMLESLGDELERLAADDDIDVVVLTGAGRSFCAGVDLKALGDRELVGGSVGDLLDVPARRVTALLASMPAITIAKVNGFCFTGALELVLACDLAVAANEAKFADTHAKFGLRPTWGMSARLPRAKGRDSLLAYKNLYRAGAELPLTGALGYESSTGYDIADTADRLDGFR